MVDSVEAWLAGVSFWIQVPILLAVLVPLCWLLAGVIDRLVDLVLRRHGTDRSDEASGAAEVVPDRAPVAKP